MPSSRTKKNKLLPKEKRIINIIIKISALVNIWYTLWLLALIDMKNKKMVSLTCFKRRFTPRWYFLLLSLIAMGFFTRLGFWQLARATEKENLVQAHALLAAQSPINWAGEGPLPQQYQQLEVKGQYLAFNFLLDNQHYQHRFGYNLLTPILLATNKVVLIDRGWLAGDLSRQTLPLFKTPAGEIKLKGSAYQFSKHWLLGQVVEEKEKNLFLIEEVNIKLISQLLHKSVYPFIIRLDKGEKGGYVREWPVVSMPPARHYGYAFQWFAFAVVILILFITLNLKKNDENN